MKRRLFAFSLSAWTATIVISPVLFFALIFDYSGAFKVKDFLSFWGSGLLGGFVLSLPGYLLFIAALFYLNSRKWKNSTKKVILILWSILLIVIPVYFIFGTDDDSLYFRYVPRIIISYSSTMIVSMLVLNNLNYSKIFKTVVRK